MVGKVLVVVVACSLLAACGHSRVARRDYDSPPPRSSSSTRARPPVSRAAPSPIPSGAVHVVRAGETLYGISFRFGLRYQDVAAWNRISDPYTIEVGQRLRLRPPGSMPSSPPADNGNIASATPQRLHPLSPNPSRPVNPAAVAAPPTRPPVSTVGAPSWRWPAQGQIIGRYVSGDQTQQGINIAGSAGQPILAASDGIVVYSGAGLVGYGELIIIKHSDEWLSAYAHNRRRLVVEGSRVKSGEVIAEMGKTGAIREMLHFEIRRNGKPVDPLAFLPRP